MDQTTYFVAMEQCRPLASKYLRYFYKLEQPCNFLTAYEEIFCHTRSTSLMGME